MNDDTEHTRFVSLAGESPLRAYVAKADDRVSGGPAIVLAMHLWGVDAEQRATARRFAAAGFTTIVPDLYGAFDAPSGDGASDPEAFLPFALRLDAAAVDRDLLACAAWLRARDPRARVAIAGFCMGGVMALRRTAGYANVFAAAAVWYGSIARAAVSPERVDIPVVGSFGAGDAGIPAADVEAFARGVMTEHDFKIYPGAGHGFFDRHRSAYEPEAAEDSWRRTIDFLNRHLRAADGRD